MRPVALQVMEVLGVVRLFDFEEGEDDALGHVCTLEDKLMTIAFNEKKQKAITDYFGQ